MQTTQRGYRLTGRDRCEDAEATVPAVIGEVAKLVADNRAQQQTIARLRMTDHIGQFFSAMMSEQEQQLSLRASTSERFGTPSVP
jgi:hypothetical protein